MIRMSKVEEPNDKVREQIEEILEREEKRTPAPPRQRPTPITVARQAAPKKNRVTISAKSNGIPLWYPTPEKLIVAGMLLLLVAAVGRKFVLPLSLAGFALAGIGYIMLVRRRRSGVSGFGKNNSGSQAPNYWRGKPVSKPTAQVKKRGGNVLEFPEEYQAKRRGWFGKKK